MVCTLVCMGLVASPGMHASVFAGCGSQMPKLARFRAHTIGAYGTRRLVLLQAVTIAAVWLACKVDEVSGSGAAAHSGAEDPFPDKDRGSLSTLVKTALVLAQANVRAGSSKDGPPGAVRPCLACRREVTTGGAVAVPAANLL